MNTEVNLARQRRRETRPTAQEHRRRDYADWMKRARQAERQGDHDLAYTLRAHAETYYGDSRP